MVVSSFNIIGRCLFSETLKTNIFEIQCRGVKACLLGAMGNIGQPLALLLKQSHLFEETALVDKQDCRGLAMELNHIDTPCLATAYEGEEGMKQALQGSQIVINVAGSKGSSVSTSDDELFSINAPVAYKLSSDCAQYCPQAFHVIVTSPVNSIVPIVHEAFKKVAGCVDPSKIFGLTSVNTLRTISLVADITQISPDNLKVPVIGGHSSTTIIPLLSKTEPCVSLTTEEALRITKAVQNAGEDVYKAKDGLGTAYLSVAYAAARMAENLAKAIFGDRGIIDCAFVRSNLISEVKYFSSPLILGPTGVQKILPLPELNNYETCLLHTCIENLKKEIERGEKFAIS